MDKKECFQETKYIINIQKEKICIIGDNHLARMNTRKCRANYERKVALKEQILKQPLEVFRQNKVFLQISQNSQEKNLCQSLFFNKVVGLRLQLYSNKDSSTGVFLLILRNF